MSIKLNWERVQRVHKELEDKGYIDSTPLIFILFMSDGSPRKTEITFGDFMQVFWSLSDSEDLRITSFLVQNKTGAVLYRHRRISGNEEIPNGGNTHVVTQWNSLEPDEQDMYSRMMIAQINAYDK